MGSKENLKLAKSVYDMFNKGDLDGAAGLAAPSMHIDLITMGMTFAGPEGFMDFMQGFKEAFPDIQLSIENQVADDDHVVTEFTWSGTNTGPLPSPTGPIPATGKPVKGARVCEVWTIAGGKIKSLINYQDAATWLRQLGLVQ